VLAPTFWVCVLAACGGRPDAPAGRSDSAGSVASARPDSTAPTASVIDSGSLASHSVAGQEPAPRAARPPRVPPAEDSALRMRPALLPRPDTLRGLYVNRWAAIGPRMFELIALAKRTEVNALVIDVKDDRGFLLYPSRVALAREIGADALNDTILPMSVRRMRTVLDTMRANNIYPIARIVVAKDPLLAGRKGDWSIRRKSDGQPWLDDAGNPWLDPHRDSVWDYAADLAVEAADLGFSEVQFDYVRFPDDKRLIREATFPLAAGRARATVVHEQLARVRSALTAAAVPMGIDVFGLTTSDSTDMGIGQRWELFVDQADAVLPMMYPSHYAAGTYGFSNPNANPFGIIDHGLKDALRRSEGVTGAARIVPWYQDFTLGTPRYGAEQVRAQMRAGYENGIASWILWNPRSVYTVSALEPVAPVVVPPVTGRDPPSGRR
jgi:hypothetical protein